MKENEEKVIFGFDVGLGSLGIAVRRGNDIVHADSLLIDPDLGLVKDERERRRAYRTRQTHKAREKKLIELWKNIGEEPLLGAQYEPVLNHKNKAIAWHFKKGDWRLEREFSAKDDSTIYTSCLLRILLLEGKKLEPWQIFKALRSAIQRRGYDKNVPWKTREKGSTEKNDTEEKEIKASLEEYEKRISQISKDEKFQYPCYLDAYLLGFWKDGKILYEVDKNGNSIPPRLHLHRKNEFKKARGYIAPRKVVIAELKSLLENAAKQLPELEKYTGDEKTLNELLYGKPDKDKEKADRNKRENFAQYPSVKKVDGLLAQKYPRFENRAVGHCTLIPRFHVCKKADPLFIQARFLLELENFRYEKLNNGIVNTCLLTAEEKKTIFQEKKDARASDLPEDINKVFQLNKKYRKKIAKYLGGQIKSGHEGESKSSTEEKVQTSITGRCRYSRPALAILQDFILSGKSNTDYYKELLSRLKTVDPEVISKSPVNHGDYWLEFPELNVKKCRVFKEELNFITQMVNEAGALYIPQLTLAEKYGGKKIDYETQIQKLIASCPSSVVRHRLVMFKNQLEKLISKNGEPDHVCIEFVRSELSEKQKRKHEAQMQKGQRERSEAIHCLIKHNIPISEPNITKARLIKEQKYTCMYTGKSLCISKIEEYEIEHILPDAKGGPTSLYNLVVPTPDDYYNQYKKDNIPADVPKIQEIWDAYKKLVEKTITDKKKIALLLASDLEEAQGIANRYMGLAKTSWIARLARDIVCLRMDWPLGEKGESKKITIISGGKTNKFARRYNLYRCLGDGTSNNKDRSDDRHHALDAMLLTYFAEKEWVRNETKEAFFSLPAGINQHYFSKILSNVHPRIIKRVKAKISEQPVGVRLYKNNKTNDYEPILVQRKDNAIHTDRKKVSQNFNEYTNLNKNSQAERGIYFTNRSQTGKGTTSHGRLFCRPANPEGEILVKPIPAFDSPYLIKQKFEREGYRVKQLRRGDLVLIEENLIKKEKPMVTKLGKEVRLSDYGEYTIIKELTKEYDIRKYNNSTGVEYEYRVKHRNIERFKAQSAIQVGAQIDIFEFKHEKKRLTGTCTIISNDYNAKTVTLLFKSEEIKVKYSDLLSHLTNSGKYTLELGESIEIHKPVDAVLPETRVSLESGNYMIRSYGNTAIVIQNNKGEGFRFGINTFKELIDFSTDN